MGYSLKAFAFFSSPVQWSLTDTGHQTSAHQNGPVSNRGQELHNLCR